MDKRLSPAPPPYQLEEQVGFLLRRATQRHLAIFSRHLACLTPTQFAALSKLCALGPRSQNALGRATAMDAATIKGVVDRLRAKGLVEASRDDADQRRLTLSASAAGMALMHSCTEAALQISDETLGPLDPEERAQFLGLLARLG